MSQYNVELVFGNGYFIRIPRFYTSRLKLNELVVLSFLISWFDMRGKPEKHGWFFCKMDLIMDELNIGRTSQTKIMRSLEKQGYIQTKTEGMPPTRWIKINFNKISEEMTELIEEHKKKEENRRKKDKKLRKHKRERREMEREYSSKLVSGASVLQRYRSA